MVGENFFDSPGEHSVIKTEMVSKYFDAWTKIMLNVQARSSRIAYIDLFCGPGKFSDGSESTPLWILRSAIESAALRTRLVTMFNDRDPNHAQSLRAAISELPRINELAHPPSVSSTEVGATLVNMLRDMRFVPTLFFVDPWGYKGLSLDLIGNAVRSWGCDCIFFFNYNRINPGINNPFVAELMRDIFGVTRFEGLRTQLAGRTPEQRRILIVSELAAALREVGGEYVLPFEFKNRHGARTSHYLIFVTKHFRGYHIMKEIMFGLSSDDGDVRAFEYTPVRNAQLSLLDALMKPYSIEALKETLMRDCAGQTQTVEKLYENHSVDTPYILRNFQEAIKALEADGKVTVDVAADKRPKRNGEVTLAKGRIVTFQP